MLKLRRREQIEIFRQLRTSWHDTLFSHQQFFDTQESSKTWKELNSRQVFFHFFFIFRLLLHFFFTPPFCLHFTWLVIIMSSLSPRQFHNPASFGIVHTLIIHLIPTRPVSSDLIIPPGAATTQHWHRRWFSTCSDRLRWYLTHSFIAYQRSDIIGDATNQYHEFFINLSRNVWWRLHRIWCTLMHMQELHS